MSEQTHSSDPISTAYELERQIAEAVAVPSDSARKHVRSQMEQWLGLMHDPKVRAEYQESFGDLPVERTEAELLTMIKGTYPKVAAQLGWNADMEKMLTTEDADYSQTA